MMMQPRGQKNTPLKPLIPRLPQTFCWPGHSRTVTQHPKNEPQQSLGSEYLMGYSPFTLWASKSTHVWENPPATFGDQTLIEAMPLHLLYVPS